MTPTRQALDTTPATDPKIKRAAFEKLLNDSSLGSPRARAVRQHTPQDLRDLLSSYAATAVPGEPADLDGLVAAAPDAESEARHAAAPSVSRQIRVKSAAAALALPLPRDAGTALEDQRPDPLRTEVADTIAAGRTGATLARMILGSRLRKLREASGITRQQAALAIRASQSKLCRLELGRTGFKRDDVLSLLTLYAVTDPAERIDLLALTDQANTPPWWHSYTDLVPSWAQTYLGLEQAASLVRTYEIRFVPGLLQTPDYARSVIARSHEPRSAADIDRLVELRTRRQEALHRTDPPRLWAVIDEAALRVPAGSRSVMHAQIRHLIEMTDLPHVTVHVLPRDRSGTVAVGHPIVLLRFPNRDIPDIVYLEQLTSAVFLDGTTNIGAYLEVMNSLAVEAALQSESRSLLHDILRTL